MSFHSGANYLALPVSDQPWIVQNVLPIGGMLNIYGKPKTGKSMIGLQLAEALSSGKKEWLSFGLAVNAPVAYLQIDTPRSLWMDRVKHLQKYGLDFSKVYFADTEDQDIPYPFDILSEGGIWLKKQFELISEELGSPPPVLFIDTLREIHSGSEDESAQMKNVIAAARAAVPGTSIVFISHSRKGSPQHFGIPVDIMDENRGSGYTAGKMDCILFLQEKSLTGKGRALGDTHIEVEMDPDSYEIKLSDKFVKEGISIAETGRGLGAGITEMTKILNDLFPKKSMENCKSLIQRLSPGAGV